MPHIVVTSLARLHDTVEQHEASHIVTLINEGTPVTRPVSIEEKCHLFLGMHDIDMAMDGMTPPASSRSCGTAASEVMERRRWSSRS